MNDYSVDMVNYAVDQKPNEFTTAFNAAMHQKVTDMVAAAKQQLAQGYLSNEQSEQEQENSEEISDEDTETNT